MTNWLRTRVDAILDQEDLLPATSSSAASAGISNTWKASTRSSLEASAYGLRAKPERRARDEWYRWLTSQYAALIAQMQPAVGARERERKSHAILTLTLGGWITHGRGSRLGDATDVVGQRQLLMDTAMEIALQ